MRGSLVLCALAVLLAGCACTGPYRDQPSVDRQALEQQVADTERAFARTMTVRDHAAFKSFVSKEAVFFGGGAPLRGQQQVAEAWKPYFEEPEPPFSWEPQQVEVLDSGTLALSTGPVHDPEGRLIATFTSIWRQEAPGIWHIVFDRGSPACPPRE